MHRIHPEKLTGRDGSSEIWFGPWAVGDGPSEIWFGPWTAGDGPSEIFERWIGK